jgi:hypothetical protein
MLKSSQIWRRQFACFTASLCAAMQPVVLRAAEPALPAPLLAENMPATKPAAQNVPATVAPSEPATPKIPLDPAQAAAVLPDPNIPAPQPILATPSQNVTLNLINRLVQKGVLSHAEAADLIKGAEEDAAFAKAQAQALADTQAAVAAQSAMPPVEPDAEEVRVTYIPESVKAQIRDQLRAEVFEQARNQKWAAPNEFPEWTSRIRFFGDMRMRQESLMYPSGNDNVTGAFPNFNAINSGQPWDFRNAAGLIPPQLNVDRDRDRTRLRMRLGFDIDLEDGFTAGIRLATGGNNSPVSTNQTLGSANANSQGGGFSKYELWLDRAFMKYEADLNDQSHLMIELGRFQNPFYQNSQIMWDEDVNLDGLAFTLTNSWNRDFNSFFTAGAFPVFNTALNSPDNSTTKAASYDKYLIAAQFGVQFKLTEDIEVKSGITYYHWENIEGRFSSPFVPSSPNDAGDTDDSRPLFAQKGNTYRPIRNIVATPGAAPGGNLNGTINQYQYFGLATKFRQLAWSGRIDFNHWEPLQVSLMADVVKNFGLNAAAMKDLTRRDAVVNNRSGGAGAWEGGDLGWYVGLNLGKPVALFDQRGDWAFNIGYRHVESDAVVDGFSESRFGNGGSNMEGYTIQALYALSKRTWTRLAYMSASQIAGPPLQTDVFLIEFLSRF